MTETDEYLDTVFDTLRSRERRHILTYLQEDLDHDASLDELAAFIASNADVIEDAKISLVHNHLPRLKEEGWIDYDQRTAHIQNDIYVESTKDELLLDYLSDASNQADEYLDTVFDALADDTRRRTLYILEQEDGRSTISHLAAGLSEDATDKDEYDRMRTLLSHQVLPKLAEQGWVEYDWTQKIRLTLDKDEEPDGLLLQYLEQAYGTDPA